MRRLLVVALVIALILLAGCASEIDPDEAYRFGYEDGYEKGFNDGYAAAADSSSSPAKAAKSDCDYVLNKNSKKFHYPSCGSVFDMAEKNKIYFTGSRDEVIAMGYVPCKRCNP